LREFLGQRSDIQQLQKDSAAANRRVAELEEQKARLEDPSYTAALARDRLHFVRPGETAYVVIAPSAPPVAPKDAERAANAPTGRLESDGLMKTMTARLADDPELAERYAAAARDYVGRRDAIERLGHGENQGGMPNRVKCLHVLVAHSLAVGRGVNPFGDEAL